MIVYSIHIAVTMLHTKPGVVERLLNDIRECVQEIMKNPDAKCEGTVCLTFSLLKEDGIN